jgi:hypothetical protein
MKPFPLRGGTIEVRYVPAAADYPDQFTIEMWDGKRDRRFLLPECSEADIRRLVKAIEAVLALRDRYKLRESKEPGHYAACDQASERSDAVGGDGKGPGQSCRKGVERRHG